MKITEQTKLFLKHEMYKQGLEQLAKDLALPELERAVAGIDFSKRRDDDSCSECDDKDDELTDLKRDIRKIIAKLKTIKADDQAELTEIIEEMEEL